MPLVSIAAQSPDSVFRRGRDSQRALGCSFSVPLVGLVHNDHHSRFFVEPPLYRVVRQFPLLCNFSYGKHCFGHSRRWLLRTNGKFRVIAAFSFQIDFHCRRRFSMSLGGLVQVARLRQHFLLFSAALTLWNCSSSQRSAFSIRSGSPVLRRSEPQPESGQN